MENSNKTNGQLFEDLVKIMAQLRNPKGGCPWDLEQSHKSLKPYVIEEAYEVVDAIEYTPEKLPEELGDLLLQVVFHAQLGAEAKSFDIADVIKAICEKLIRRHPHVFGETKVENASEVLKNWEQIKKTENKAAKSVLDGVPRSMPALQRAQRLGEKAARIGFDWQDLNGVSDKVFEEIKEFLDEQDKCAKAKKETALSPEAREEFGDLLFALSQWARKAGLNPEELLSQANDKFHSRFRRMEECAAKPLKEHSTEELENLWNQIKHKA